MIEISQVFARREFECDEDHDHEYQVQYGINNRQIEPALEILSRLRERQWENSRLPKSPDDAQFDVYDQLIGIIDAIASGGEVFDDEFNYLHHGIWEIKHANVRISFYETDGMGSISTDSGEIKGTNRQGYTIWYFPELDDIVRLGHCWEKLGRRAGDQNIISATKFRSEDVRHDRENRDRP